MSKPAPLNPRQGIYRLAAACVIASVCWLILLPALSKYPPMSARLQWLEEQQVDPSAMYYTEVEALKPVLQQLNERGRGNVHRNSTTTGVGSEQSK